MEVFRHNGVDYPSLPSMEEAVGKKSSLSKYKENDKWINEYQDYSQEHLDYMAQVEINMQLDVKKARLGYLVQELLFDNTNQEYMDEAITLRSDIKELGGN